MAAKSTIAIVGPGRLGSALALQLARAGYVVSEVISREVSRRKARELARNVGARSSTSDDTRLDAKVIWFCVPDRQIAAVSRSLASLHEWKGRFAFHSSGALCSDELAALRRRGAAVASVHPLMTFVGGVVPSLGGVPFALEGDAPAVREARKIVRGLGGEAFKIRKQQKAAYHAWGAFVSPLLLAALVTAEHVARAAGISPTEARQKMLPIIKQTIANYAALGPARAFSGPIVRGDAEIVRQHLRVLKRIPAAREVYLALARAALRYLPAENRNEMRSLLGRD